MSERSDSRSHLAKSGNKANVSFRLDDAELQRALTQLGIEMGQKTAERAVRAGGREIRDAIKNRAPVGRVDFGDKEPGGLEDSIIIKPSKFNNPEKFDVLIGPSHPKGAHAHLVEYGTQAHETPVTDSKGRVHKIPHPGSKPDPFMRLGFEDSEKEAVVKARKVLERAIRKVARAK